MRPRISVVINTLNEERNLPYALRSVRPWADEIIVVDMHSDDRTVEIAREYGAKVYFHERISAFDGARAFAIAQATGNWVFLLDADEMIPRSLSKRLLQIASADATDVVILPRLNYLLGSPLRHTGWGPYQDRHPRFFRKDRVDLSPRIHAFIRPVSGARTTLLPNDERLAFHHFNYLDCAHFLEKLNRYTTIEAEQALARGERSGVAKTALRALCEFMYRYLYKGGYLDGWRGFYLSGFMAMYGFATSAKLQELRSGGDRSKVIEKYRNYAEELIDGYQEDPVQFGNHTEQSNANQRAHGRELS